MLRCVFRGRGVSKRFKHIPTVLSVKEFCRVRYYSIFKHSASNCTGSACIVQIVFTRRAGGGAARNTYVFLAEGVRVLSPPLQRLRAGCLGEITRHAVTHPRSSAGHGRRMSRPCHFRIARCSLSVPLSASGTYTRGGAKGKLNKNRNAVDFCF